MNNPQTLAQAALPFEWQGKTYNLGVADYEAELYFQARHEAWVRNRIEAVSGMVSDDVTRTDVDAFARQRAGNLFAFGGLLSMQWLLSDDGFTEYAVLLCGKGKSTQGGAVLSKEALRSMKRTDKDSWDRLVRLVLRRDFPNVMKAQTDDTSSGATPSSTTSGSSNDSAGNPGSWADAKSSAFPTTTSAT